jgi:hypothetical protein
LLKRNLNLKDYFFFFFLKARHIPTASMRALKVIKLEAGDDFNIIQQEILMMLQCGHPNIIAYFGSYLK